MTVYDMAMFYMITGLLGRSSGAVDLTSIQRFGKFTIVK